MHFEIFDHLLKRNVCQHERFYVNGCGQLFSDCDPNEVDMSGKRRIVAVDSNRFEIVEKEAQSANIANTTVALLLKIRDYVKEPIDCSTRQYIIEQINVVLDQQQHNQGIDGN